jgi:hypothetical protein
MLDNRKADPMVHLYRGAPPVRSWSKYQDAVHGWTLCGIERTFLRSRGERAVHCIENAEAVSLVPTAKR